MNICIIILLGLVCACISPHGSTAAMENESRNQVNAGLEKFSISLYQELRREKMDNLVSSTLSAAVALTILWLGAGGHTAQQLHDVLHLPQDRSRVVSGYSALLASLNNLDSHSKRGEALLRLANRLYLQQECDVQAPFSKTINKAFKSDVQKVDFGDTEEARDIIDSWVKKYTNGKIMNIIPEGVLSPSSLLVLVNAIYFRAPWDNAFQQKNTQTYPFHVSMTEDVDTAMMRGSFTLNYGKVDSLDATVVKLPYQSSGIEVAMLILLPNSVEGLDDMENNLEELNISRIKFEVTQVALTIPKFRIETTLPLKKILQKMGVTEVFESGANLTGISSTGLVLSDVVQKVFIDVDEKGTEASAATVVISGRSISLRPEIGTEFNVDHPFLFFLMFENSILFMGRVKNPKL